MPFGIAILRLCVYLYVIISQLLPAFVYEIQHFFVVSRNGTIVTKGSELCLQIPNLR